MIAFVPAALLAQDSEERNMMEALARAVDGPSLRSAFTPTFGQVPGELWLIETRICAREGSPLCADSVMRRHQEIFARAIGARRSADTVGAVLKELRVYVGIRVDSLTADSATVTLSETRTGYSRSGQPRAWMSTSLCTLRRAPDGEWRLVARKLTFVT